MGAFDATWHHIRRSPYQALAAVLTMTLTFFVASLLILTVLGTTKIINFFESKPQISAFFKDEVTDEDIKGLENQLKATGKVSQISFVSKEEALKIYQEQFKDDPLLLDLVTANILPSSLEVSATEVGDLASLADTVKASPLIEEVVFQKDIVDTLTSWTNAIRLIGSGLIVVLIVESTLILIMVIGIQIGKRKNEIEIMRLVGASSWYIRWPFIIEGSLYGIVGAFVAWAFSYSILLYLAPFLESFLVGIPLLPVHPLIMLALLGVEVGTAAFLGAFGSFLAVLRYLK